MPLRAFRVASDGSSTALPEVPSRNEEKDLQRLLELNLDLIPGDQIDEENPPRWLLIRREMPVHSPETGRETWSVDLFLADQDGRPTLVECKRVQDTRSRREVVGQMLDYAANGHFYWTRERLREFAEDAATKRGKALEALLGEIGVAEPEEVDAYFDTVVENLREGQLRLVFFMDHAPYELRSIVEFLNKQTERTEILIVEARQYKDAMGKIVVPTVFGYTEQARRVKRVVHTTPAVGGRRRWSQADLMQAFTVCLGQETAERIIAFRDRLVAEGFTARSGTGVRRGSMNLVYPDFSRRSVISLYTDGQLYLNVYWLDRGPPLDALLERIRRSTGLDIPVDAAERADAISFDAEEWLPHEKALERALLGVRGDQPAAE